MKQYKFTIVVRSPMDVKDMVWAFTHKLKDAFPIVSITFDEVSDRPTTTEHHGGVESKEPEPYTKEQKDWMKQIPERY